MEGKKKSAFWNFRNVAERGAELLLYGDISERTWFGDEVTPRQFNDDLEALGDVQEITVRINSGGGDVFAALAIGNMLKNHPAHITARIEGCCCSASTVIASCCDTVQAEVGTIYMIHPVSLGLCDYFNAEQLRKYISALEAIEDGILNIYANKTKRGKEELSEWMSATSWWTPAEAQEKGFVDELLDDGQKPILENRNNRLFVNSVNTNWPIDKAPKFVQESLAAKNAVGHPENNKPKNTKEEAEMEEKNPIKTVDDLRQNFPALVDQIERAAAENATKAERERIRDIEEATLAGSEALAAEAKFTKPMSAADFYKAVLKNAKDQGAAYLAQVKRDAEDSGANSVRNATPAGQSTGDAFLAAIRSVKETQ